MSDIYGTGEPIAVGTQVVVKGQGMGTVVTVGCPVFAPGDGTFAYHVLIDGDREATCFSADAVVRYADIYAGIAAMPEDDPRVDHEPVLEQGY